MKRRFNLIEITLAIAVIGVGMAGVMALFPVGFKASKDAIGDNYSADAAEQFLSYMARACQADWNGYISTTDAGGYITSSVPTISDSLISTASWLQSGEDVHTNVFLIDAGTKNIYGLKQPATATPDFTAHMKIWKSQITNMDIGGTGGIALPYYNSTYNVGAARLNAEISWPVGIPYSKREKRFYCLEIFKQN